MRIPVLAALAVPIVLVSGAAAVYKYGRPVGGVACRLGLHPTPVGRRRGIDRRRESAETRPPAPSPVTP